MRDKLGTGYISNGWLTCNGKYTVGGGCSWLKRIAPRWSESRWVWNNMNVPKHSIICWLAMHMKLQTRERLKRMGICQDTTCLLCGRLPESVDHLMFECQFSKICLTEVLQWSKIHVRNTNMQGMWRRITKNVKGRVNRSFMMIVLVALVYGIWTARNEALWQQRGPQLKQDCKYRAFESVNRGQHYKAREWIEEYR